MKSPTLKDIETARRAYENNEPRDLFYRVAIELIDLILRGATSLSLAEALAVLLQTWNSPFYKYRQFDAQHFLDIEALIKKYKSNFLKYRKRSIENFDESDEPTVKKLFKSFEVVLGPVGAAKCLHLLCPQFFPIWDRTIAVSFGLRLEKAGENGKKFCRFMSIMKSQVKSLKGCNLNGGCPLKALDEYNYCKYTKKWI